MSDDIFLLLLILWVATVIGIFIGSMLFWRWVDKETGVKK